MNSDAAPSTAFEPLQMAIIRGVQEILRRGRIIGAAIIGFLDRERAQLPVWAVVAFGVGIASWFLLGGVDYWVAFMALGLALAFGVPLFAAKPWSSHLVPRCIVIASIMAVLGMGSTFLRSQWVAPETLERPYYGPIVARITEREEIPARGIVRFELLTPRSSDLPRKVRVNLDRTHDSQTLQPGTIIQARVRLMPPAQAALPGAYNFARRAWFEGLGASGTLLGKPQIIKASDNKTLMTGFRASLSTHIREQMPGGAGAIAATLATGDRGAIAEEDAEAMRRSGLAHLLSISGLHVSAVIAASWIVFMRIMALSPLLAHRFRLPLGAALFSACTGIGYTLMTGAEVPTIRACIAAMMVLLALAMGRDPISLRLVAFGAFVVLVMWPEALMGPSFQMSFAAVTAIIALHDHPRMRTWMGDKEMHLWRRFFRGLAALFLTGLLIEFTLMPIALFHFHKAGLYGAFANLIAIPLTTFVIMPLEALALFFDLFGLGAPFWRLCGLALNALIGLAHQVANAPGAATFLPSMGNLVFGLFVFGGLWLFLWRSAVRYWGLLPFAVASCALMLQQGPDILVTSDARHMALRTGKELVTLKGRIGDYALHMLQENAGFDEEPVAMADWAGADCSDAFCSFAVRRDNKTWRILASRNRDYVPLRSLYAACRRADIVISERYLPRNCNPRWLKADRAFLQKTGGITIYLGDRHFKSVADENRGHPWFDNAMR